MVCSWPIEHDRRLRAEIDIRVLPLVRHVQMRRTLKSQRRITYAPDIRDFMPPWFIRRTGGRVRHREARHGIGTKNDDRRSDQRRLVNDLNTQLGHTTSSAGLVPGQNRARRRIHTLRSRECHRRAGRKTLKCKRWHQISPHFSAR